MSRVTCACTRGVAIAKSAARRAPMNRRLYFQLCSFVANRPRVNPTYRYALATFRVNVNRRSGVPRYTRHVCFVSHEAAWLAGEARWRDLARDARTRLSKIQNGRNKTYEESPAKQMPPVSLERRISKRPPRVSPSDDIDWTLSLSDSKICKKKKGRAGVGTETTRERKRIKSDSCVCLFFFFSLYGQIASIFRNRSDKNLIAGSVATAPSSATLNRASG